VNDSTITKLIGAMTPKERAALAVAIDVNARTVARWKKKPETLASLNAHVRAALEKALQGRGK
jgi:hypothetical protein